MGRIFGATSLGAPAIDRKESCLSSVKDITSQLSASIFLPVVPPQRSTSAPPVSNQEPLRLELKQQKEHERVGALLRGVSQDFSQTLAEPMSSVPLAQCPVPTTSTARARTGEQAGQAPFLSTAGVDSPSCAAITAAVTAQAATSVSPGGIAGVVDGALPCRRLEKESARIGNHVKRGMKSIDKEYKLELKLLKENARIA
ncbi:hypothetical protein SMACR_09336 [Sordaria macrospora]|uniref:WGS project CABT00000000 data, contig 2.85 n=2 Tax=Sordaria macrospora TaxID=5147 RepID=F7WBV0_SORMK|nr:uncharacterized protein SMAC_09336 [Sordaria macrospora k-hell]KAA8624186.1 hypothetical protein SMACR_09336 [Sordaria macrospora]KAH7626132.1 hypothetical protein B0T09DRAFT_360794 [Sordaria sp. MPI-SDFR-AT-0083]WPJ61304.1 hypothetical protein SMAC4_09336 [Sordaria macrospora]CCC14493.1 unnamed protein product [Sordaria macrospora k-hell]